MLLTSGVESSSIKSTNEPSESSSSLSLCKSRPKVNKSYSIFRMIELYYSKLRNSIQDILNEEKQTYSVQWNNSCFK